MPKKGFTLVEVLVVAPIIILSIGAFIAVVVSLTGNVLVSRSASMLQYDIQDAADRIEADIRMSPQFLSSTSNIPFTASNPQGYTNTPNTPSSGTTTLFTNIDKTSTGGSTASLILRTYLTDKNPVRAQGDVSLLHLPTPTACTGNYRTNQPAYGDIVYFISDNALWRRTILPANYATANYCGGVPYQQPSCSPGTTHAFCKVVDSRLIGGVDSVNFSVAYYTNEDATSANSTAVSASSSDAAREAILSGMKSALVSITAEKEVAGRTIERSVSLRTSRLNNL